MAETPPPSGPLAEASGRELRELQQFLLYLGSALTAAGEAVNHVATRATCMSALPARPRQVAGDGRPVGPARLARSDRR